MGNRFVIEPGDVIAVDLPMHIPAGHEQEGRKPAIVVGVPPQPLRYGVLTIVPMTAQTGRWADLNPLVYPRLPRGIAGLSLESVALLDQIRCIDSRRLFDYLGTLDRAHFGLVRACLREILSNSGGR